MGVPTGAFTRNGVVLDIAGAPADLHFRKISGLVRGGGNVIMTDGKSRSKYYFNDNIVDYGDDFTLVRVPDGGEGDAYLEELTRKCLEENYKFECTLHKYHGKQEVMTFELEGVRVTRQEHPEYDADADGEGARLEMTYKGTVDIHTRIL